MTEGTITDRCFVCGNLTPSTDPRSTMHGRSFFSCSHDNRTVDWWTDRIHGEVIERIWISDPKHDGGTTWSGTPVPDDPSSLDWLRRYLRGELAG